MERAADWLESARAHRADQRMIEADKAMAAASALAPGDPLIAFLFAQSRYELGLPAASLFERARQLEPENREALRNQALALASEDRLEQGAALLAGAVREDPFWLEGHRILASLRWIGGQAEGFDDSFRQAARENPSHTGLWLGWFAAVAQHRDWPRARALLEEAQRYLPNSDALLSAWLFLAVESGDESETDRLLAATAGRQDDFLAVARIRAAFRARQPERALAIALPLASGRIAGQVWPYISAGWRLLGDKRAGWLDGDPPYVAMADVGLSAGELEELAALLRTLHAARRPYAEQSVRSGTQTDRNLLLRHEPLLRRAREALLEAVRNFVGSLPERDPRHPLLAPPRDRLKISGSWSVRLGPGGYNRVHSHPMGWISSAFYVTLPDPDQMGPPPGGYLQLGAPPPELELGLAPIKTIVPEAGKLVLFPSTLWHGTVPIQSGERMNIAFDIVPA